MGTRTGLLTLNLSGNQFSGAIPKGLENLRKLYLLDLSDNQLTGSIPAWQSNLGAGSWSNLTLDLSGNQLTGTIPATLGNLKLGHLDLSNNNFTAGDFPSWIANETTLRTLKLSNVNLTGTFPATTTWSSLTSLSHLNLSNNNFTQGTFPDLSSLPLSYLDLSDNSFTFTGGNFPTWITSETSLTTLYLSNVNFTGTFPTALSSLTSLNHLDLSDNAFTAGAIPDLSAIRYLWTLNLSNTNRTGAFPTHLSKMYYLIHFDLSHNQLSGSIPAALGDNLGQLAYLDFSHNQLTDSIPSSFGNLSTLQTFNLSHNKFTGTIPNLGSLTLLYLDLSNNNFNHRGLPLLDCQRNHPADAQAQQHQPDRDRPDLEQPDLPVSSQPQPQQINRGYPLHVRQLSQPGGT